MINRLRGGGEAHDEEVQARLIGDGQCIVDAFFKL